MTTIALFLNIPRHRELADRPLQWKLRQLDIPGTILVAAGAICILLALQLGRQSYAVSACSSAARIHFTRPVGVD